jgi:hypothetical protein
MPLSNNNFQWRPNDNSGLTNLRYDLEASKWYNALVEKHNNVTKYSGHGLGFASDLITFIFCLILLVLIGIMYIVKEIAIKLTKKKSPEPYFEPKTRKDYSDMLLRTPIREDYADHSEYMQVLSAYLMKRNHIDN